MIRGVKFQRGYGSGAMELATFFDCPAPDVGEIVNLNGMGYRVQHRLWKFDSERPNVCLAIVTLGEP